MRASEKEMMYLEKELYDLLKNDESIFYFLQESALDGLWYWDLSRPEYEWMNHTFWEILGYDPESKEHTPSAWMDIVNKDDLKIAEQRLQEHLEDPEKPYDQIIRYTHAEGHTVWIRCRGLALRDEEGTPIRMLGAHTDVSEAKIKEELLERCNSISGIGYWELNYKTGETEWSSTTRRIFEAPDNYQPVREHFLGTYPDELHKVLVDIALEEAVTDGREKKVETLIVTFSGNQRWVDLLIIPVIYNGECVKFYGTIHDIDLKKRSGQEIQRLLKKTKAQNKRLLNFTNTVSHNLRSQVGGVTSLIELIELQSPDLTEHELFKYLKMAAGNLSETMVDLTNVAVGMDFQDSDFKSVPLKAFVEKQMATMPEVMNRKAVTIRNQIPADLNIECIPVYLESIIYNLISNAIRYRDPDKNSYVELKGGFTNEGAIWFSISDNGLGIDLEKYGDKLFGMYKTFHDHEDSKGIGLFLVRNQIDTMDGTIKVESTPGTGTTFTVEIPLRKRTQPIEV